MAGVFYIRNKRRIEYSVYIKIYILYEWHILDIRIYFVFCENGRNKQNVYRKCQGFIIEF